MTSKEWNAPKTEQKNGPGSKGTLGDPAWRAQKRGESGGVRKGPRDGGGRDVVLAGRGENQGGGGKRKTR